MNIKTYQRGDVILDTYLVKDIRSGAMGNVYIADHKKWKIKVAIKAPNEKIRSDEGLFNRVLKEADAWIDLGLHPNIAYCYYVRQLDEVPHIFIEYMNGGNLRDWIADGKCYDLKVGLDLAIQFCHGMEQAHNHGMIHRDIKPANILMTREGTLKITDFGLVKTSGLDTPYAGVQGGLRGDTQFASVMGTPAYMSPEQYETPLDVDRRTDIFSFGVCMYEMFCGKLPYDQTSDALPAAYIAKLAKKTRHEPSQLRRDIPDDLADILKKCVSLDREERYSFFEELREDLTLSYRRLFDDNPPHVDVETLSLKADGLNNRGVSYLDLGREEEALKCWEEALRIDPAHFESAYNHGYLKWNKAEMTQVAVLRRLEGCIDAVGESDERRAALAWLYLEMGYLEQVQEMGLTENIDSSSVYSDISDAWFEEWQRLVRTFEGHTEAVTSVAITSDGRFALSGSHDNTLKLWEIETGYAIRTLTGHTDKVTSVAITADGRFALSGSMDKTLKLWEIATGKEIRTFTGHTDGVRSIAITPDDRFALSGSMDKTLKLWEIATGKEIRTFTGHTDVVHSIAITPDGRLTLSGSWDNTLKLWEIATGKEIRTFTGHNDWINTIAITPDGRFALSGSNDKTMKLWNIKSGKVVRTLSGHLSYVETMAITLDGMLALSGSADETLKLWEIATGKEIRTFARHISNVNCVAIITDSLHALSGSSDGSLALWDLIERPILRTVSDHYLYPLIASITEASNDIQQIKHVASLIEKSKAFIKQDRYEEAVMSLRNAQLIPGYERNSDILDTLAVYRAKQATIVNGLINCWFIGSFTGHTDCVRSIAITPDCKFALSGSWDNTLKLWEIATGKIFRTFEGHTKEVTSVVITPNGKFALSGGVDNTVKLWEIATGKRIRTFTGHAGDVDCVTVTPDGRYVLSGSSDDSMKLWEIATGREIRTFTGHNNWVSSVAITSEGKFALSGSFDNTLKLWEIATGNVIRTFTGHAGDVDCVTVTPDGRYVLSGSSDDSMKLWEIATGREIRTFKGHTEPVMSVVISPDGRFALSGSLDKTLKLWDIASGREIKSLIGHTWSVITVAITPDGRYALSGSADNSVKIWEFDWDWAFV